MAFTDLITTGTKVGTNGPPHLNIITLTALTGLKGVLKSDTLRAASALPAQGPAIKS